MNKIQTPVLVFAGVITALFFGISDLGDALGGGSKNKNPLKEIKPELRKQIAEKLELQEMLSGRRSSMDFNEQVLQYAKNLHEVESHGIGLGDSDYFDFVTKNFKTKENYKRQLKALEAGKVTEHLYQSFIEDIIKFQKLAQLKQLSIYVTKNEIKEEYHRQNDKVKFEQFLIETKKVELSEPISKEAKEKYYEENKGSQEFQEPEKVTIEYLFVNTKTLKVDNPSDKDMRAYYNENREEFKSQEYLNEAKPYFEVKEDIKKKLITKAQDDLANELLSALDSKLIEEEESKQNFKASLTEFQAKDKRFAVVQHGKSHPFSDSASDKDIKPLGFSWEIPNRIYGENPINYGGPYSIGDGVCLYRKDEAIPARVKPFEESNELITENLTEQKKDEVAKKLADEWVTKLASTSDWGKIDLSKLPQISFRIEDKLGLYEQTAKEASNLKVKEVSPVIALTGLKKGYAILRLIERKEADEKKLAQNEAMIKSTIERQKMMALQFAEMDKSSTITAKK